ncbi:hypothetical protein VE03_07956 [Pseudogymnoascus sp. 23342-1-I1]|nr:hypothetical protein VE03_07956 [Pseudogymnoascus sp. 23342-1-I1]
MRPTALSLAGLALTTLSAAQKTTVTVFAPGTENEPLVASVIGSDATATTYAIACDPSADAQDCGMEGTITLTEGPKTAKYTIAPVVDPNGETAFAGKFECSLAGTSSAVCIESHGGSDANFPGISTETYTGTDQPYIPITITAGVNRIASLSATGSGAEATQTSGTDAGAGISAADAGGSGDAATTTDSGTKGVSTGAAAAISQGAGWVLGGAAMALAML